MLGRQTKCSAHTARRRARQTGQYSRVNIASACEFSTNFSAVGSSLSRAEPHFRACVELVVSQVLQEPVAAGHVAIGVVQPVGNFAHRNFGAQPVRDVAQVAQGARQVAFFDVGVQIFDAPAADGGEEVDEVVAAGVELLDHLAVEIEGDAAGVAGQHDVAVGALEDHADVGVLKRLGLQPADLEDQRLVAVVVDDDLRIGRFARVFVAEAAAVAEHALG